jgi:hypothetical protein
MIDIRYFILELRDFTLGHLALLILLSVGFGLLYPESQLLSTYFNVNNITPDFLVVVMVANVIAMYSPAYIILKLLGKDPDKYLSLNISQ